MAMYAADLHIHTILSPCAEVEMIPPLIVEQAITAELDIIAITDHNSAENVAAVMEAAEGTSLKVIPGIECETLEGVHIVCLFDEIDGARALERLIYSALPDMRNRPEFFGAQFVVDSTGEFIRYNERLLLVPTTISIDGLVAAVNSLDGLAIPSHVDRSAYGIYGVLGFLPEAPIFTAVEISRHMTPERAVNEYPDLASKHLFRSSDAHRLEEIGTSRTLIDLRHRTVQAIKEAISAPVTCLRVTD